jgi:hypothetical protein
VDHYWDKLSAGGDEQARQCGWLKDRYGASWQVVPIVLIELITDPDYEKSRKVMAAMLQMKKIDIEGLKRAYAGWRSAGRMAGGAAQPVEGSRWRGDADRKERPNGYRLAARLDAPPRATHRR